MITGAGDWIEKWARVAPWRVAFRDVERGTVLHYGELSSRAWRLTHALAAMGVGVGDRVALVSNNRIETFELLVACLRLGAAFTPLNWRLAVPELLDILGHCDARVLVYDGTHVEKAGAILENRTDIRGLALDVTARAGDLQYEAALSQASETADGVAHDPEAIGMLLYTSGTTGRPKGVMIPHRQIFWNAVNTVYATDLGPDDRALACLPLFHTGGLNCLATPALYRGGTVILMDGFDADRALSVIESQRATMTVAVPTMYQMLLDAGLDGRDTSSLETILCGGAPLPEPLLDAWLDRGFNFRQGFGMTEVGPNCFSLPAWMARRKRGSCGMPVLHGDARVVRPDGRTSPPGEVGALQLGGPIVCAGYLDNPEATAASMTDDGWFDTGDLARTDEDGFFYIAGREKEMFISGGENVYPAEVENAILGFDPVAEVAVVGVPDPRWGEVGLAVVVPDPALGLDGFDVEAVREHCRTHLAKFKVPKRFEVVSELPKNTSGKVIKPALLERFNG